TVSNKPILRRQTLERVPIAHGRRRQFERLDLGQRPHRRLRDATLRKPADFGAVHVEFARGVNATRYQGQRAWFTSWLQPRPERVRPRGTVTPTSKYPTP